MKNKKAVINQVFVYIMSIIAILFVGFLVTKFIIAFGNDSKDIIGENFFTTLQNDLEQVASRYNSEEVLEYKINGEVVRMCFISKTSCVSNLPVDLPIEISELEILSENSNLLFFDKDTVTSQRKILDFESTQSGGCFCITPNNNRFNLLIENRKNNLYVSEYLD